VFINIGLTNMLRWPDLSVTAFSKSGVESRNVGFDVGAVGQTGASADGSWWQL
jgi:hypothetical protein